MKKIIALILSLALVLPCLPTFATPPVMSTQSVQLKVKGNKIVFAHDESVEVHLTGVNVCGSEWMADPESERVKRGVAEAIYNWDANLIRMGVSVKGWWGRYDWCHDDGEHYREYVADVINMVADSGKYIILDLHEYNYMSKEFAQFWQEATEMFGNNPAVLFGLLNEPCGDITWDTWRNGDGGDNVGLQYVVEQIRDAGAKNIIVAGGLGYSGNLQGVGSGEYALIDQGSNGDTTKTGYGIMYDAHIYPGHGQTPRWDSHFGEARKKYPILIGEYGWDPDDSVIMGNARLPDNANYHTRWFSEMFDWMDDDITYGAKANWTAWCFHPSSSPRMLEMYDKNGTKFSEDEYIFTPTEWFGQYIKDKLALDLGDNAIQGKQIISYTQGRPANSTEPSLILDGDKTTSWKCANAADKEIVIDLGAVYNINRWQVFHNKFEYDYYSYTLMTSLDGESWTSADMAVVWDAQVTDKFFKTTAARYVKLLIEATQQISEVYELRIFADNASDGHINADAPTDTKDIILYEESFDFYNGDDMPCWWSSAHYPEYIEGGAEDGIGTAMRFKDNATRMMSLQAFTDTVGYDYFEYKYKSDYPVTVHFELDYRVSDKETLKTNKITLPSTNGEWTIFRITPQQLMPTPSDEWVKNELATKTAYTGTNYEFEPILISYMNTNTTGYADFEYFKAVWMMNDLFGFESVRVLQNGLECDSLNEGTADFYIRYNNGEGRKLLYMLSVVAVYDADGKLVSIGTLPFNAGANIRTSEHKVTVDIPSDNCTAKIITWLTADSMLPLTDVVEF